jgi:hypothetical protein
VLFLNWKRDLGLLQSASFVGVPRGRRVPSLPGKEPHLPRRGGLRGHKPPVKSLLDGAQQPEPGDEEKEEDEGDPF